MAIITEVHIETPIINGFVNNLGYRHLNCYDVDTTGRESETDGVIKPLLKSDFPFLRWAVIKGD